MSLDLEPGQDGAPSAAVPARPAVVAPPPASVDDAELRWSGALGLRAKAPDALADAAWADPEDLELHLRLEEVFATPPIARLVGPDLLLEVPDPVAVDLVQRALDGLDGRGIVVEPPRPGGSWVLPLVLAELVARGLAERVLVAGAPGTAERIAADVHARVGVELSVALTATSSALSADRLVLDFDLAESEVERLAAEPWDLVVVVAAHHVAGSDASHVRAALRRVVQAAPRALLLTPAPAVDDLVELRRLAELVRPGTFRPEVEFRARLVDPDLAHEPARPDELRRLLEPVLVRPARTVAAPPRVCEPEHHEVEVSPEEQALVERGVALVAGALSGAAGWEARRRLVPHLAGPTSGLAVAARGAAEVAPLEARPPLLALAEDAAVAPSGPRQRLLGTLVRLWKMEHGRVLVAAASAETAQAVADGLSQEGDEVLVLATAAEAAAASATETLAEAPLVVAADAALAAGSLGSFGALVCADLPWDPVQVDDRLAAAGPVGDPLAVATFVQADSVDATVVAVLTEQVQLLRHGAGWARSLLDELDPATAPTGEGDAPLGFADRLVVALTEDPDDVEAALEDLDDDLEAARRRARGLHEAAARLDGWMPDPEHDAAGADEPAASDATASSCRELVARWAERSGGRLLRHEPDRLVTEGFPAPEDGERTWTFDRAGRLRHPEAELVRPGSPAFVDLAARVRSHVPVTVDVAEPVDLPVVGDEDHVEQISLVDRLVEAPTSWSARTAWRLRRGATEEAFTTVETGDPAGGLAPRRPLEPGEPLAPCFPGADALLATVAESAAAALAGEAEALAEAAAEAEDATRARLLVNHHAAVDACREAIEEHAAGTPEHDRATERLRGLHAEHPGERTIVADPGAGRLRADLVAVRLEGGDDFEVVERWRHEGGAEADVRYPWAPDGVAVRRSEVTGRPVGVLALCVDGHVVDADELVACPGCGAAGCPACGVRRELAACPTCGSEVCGTCRLHDDRFGPCSACRSPRRDEDGDTDGARCWRLGGAATLLVGRRWAELRRGPDDDVVVLVPDDDVGDPQRRRLRRAAAAAGLPLDVGATARPAGLRPLPGPDDLWFVAERGVHWELDEDGGDEVVVGLDDFDGPDGPDPEVHAESAVAVVEVLAALRAQVPPPAPPAYVRTPHTDVARTSITADGLVRTTERVGPGGDAERLGEERAPLVPASAGDGGLFRPVAVAHLDPVDVVLTRVHRSTVVRTTNPAGTVEWFVSASPGRSFGAELAWASWSEEEGLDPGAVLVVAPTRPSLADGDLATPSGAVLRRRSIVDVWGATPHPEAGDECVPAGDDDLVLVGYEQVPDLPMAEPDATHRELARALHEAGARLDPSGAVVHLLAHRCFEVEEVWEGRSSVRLAYKVSPDDPPWPRLDDTHERAADFEVDDHGHLHEPGTGWRCLACGEHHCRACGPVGAMDPCPTCSQSACGLCRARTPRTVVDERCDVCGARSCGDCGRVPDTAPCGICRRSVCRGCQVEVPEEPARCAACAALRPAAEEEVDALPEVLAAHGLQVLIGSAGGEVTLVLLGSRRSEVAVLHDQTPVWWVHHDDEDALVRGLLLAVARRWAPPGDVTPVGTGWSTRPEVEGPGFLLVAEEVPEVRWALEVDGEVVAGSAVPPRPAGATAPAHLGRVGAIDRLEPAVVDVLRREVQAGDPFGRAAAASAAAGLLQPAPGLDGAFDRDPMDVLRDGWVLEPGGRLLVEDRQHATATWLTPDGLERLISDGDEDRRTQAPWQVGVRFSWMTEGWEPVPDVVAYALLGDLEAAMVRVGRHLALGVRGDDRVVWWTLRDVPGDLERTLLGEHLTGEERLLDLRVVTDPGKVEGPTVVGASLVDRRIEPVLEEVADEVGDPDEALRAAAAWVRRRAAVPVPEGPPLDEDLRLALVGRADALSPPVLERVGIALQVVETWRQGLDDFLVPYRLAPGTTEGRVVCAATGRAERVVHRDRSGHLVSVVERCPWCEQEGCEACHERVRACAICSVGVCDRCALDDGRCPTCALLAPVDRKEAKRLGLKVGRKAVVLRAESDVRTVLAVKSGAWQVDVLAMGTPVAVLADDRRGPLLEVLAAGPAVVGAAEPPPPQPSAPTPTPSGAPAPDAAPTGPA